MLSLELLVLVVVADSDDDAKVADAADENAVVVVADLGTRTKPDADGHKHAAATISSKILVLRQGNLMMVARPQ
jgi:hypothetical protein